MALRLMNFLPSRFEGKVLDLNKYRAHYLSFSDYLEAHELNEQANATVVNNVVSLFKRMLVGQACLWIKGKLLEELETLKTSF
jgi:hypothetical protein